MRMLIYLFLICFLCSCKSNADLSMERGIQYYEWGKYNEAILEFNHAKYYQLAKKNKSYNDIPFCLTYFIFHALTEHLSKLYLFFIY